MTHEELKELNVALQRAQKEFESGRSMVEMLGVLAVIGVLSVAGVAGFKVALDKHHSNEILSEVSKRAIDAEAQLSHNTPIDQVTFVDFMDTVAGANFDSAAMPISKHKYGIVVRNVEKTVCRNLVNMMGGRSQVAKVEATDTPMTVAQCGDSNSLAFIFGDGTDSTAVAMVRGLRHLAKGYSKTGVRGIYASAHHPLKRFG